MSVESLIVEETPLVLYCLRRADDALILGHRLSEWCGHGPTLEEDMALANMALDLLGQARSLYGYAAEVEGRGADEDAYAYRRDVEQYRNLLLVEQRNGDFAHTIVRQFFYAALADPFWSAMASCGDETLSAVARKAEKEMAYHLRHCAEWVIRLGDGTDESHARVEAAVAALWCFTGEMFAVDEAERELISRGLVVDPETLRTVWSDTVTSVLRQAKLAAPETSWMQLGGRSGRHGEHLGHLLAELQHLQRSHPGAKW